MVDPNWIDPHEILPEDWAEMSDSEKAAWTRGFTAGAARVLERVMESMATMAAPRTEFDAEETREFLNAVPKEALPDA